MNEIRNQSASDTVNDNDRSSIDLEFEQLKAEYSKKNSNWLSTVPRLWLIYPQSQLMLRSSMSLFAY